MLHSFALLSEANFVLAWYRGTMLKNFQRPIFFWAGTEGQRYNAQKFSEANFFGLVQRYRGTMLQNFQRQTFFGLVHRYRGTMLHSFALLLKILKKSFNFFDQGHWYRGTMVQSSVPVYLSTF